MLLVNSQLLDQGVSNMHHLHSPLTLGGSLV